MQPSSTWRLVNGVDHVFDRIHIVDGQIKAIHAFYYPEQPPEGQTLVSRLWCQSPIIANLETRRALPTRPEDVAATFHVGRSTGFGWPGHWIQQEGLKGMGDKINRAVVKDDALHVVRGEDVWSVKAEEGKEPNEWTMVHFANVGTSEEFIETFSGEILELVDGSLIFGEERQAVKNAIMTVVVEGLMPAFEHLKKIRASLSTPLPELNRRQLYEDFARGLWHAYKDLFPKAALLLGFDIGFLFKQDAQFENGLTAFLSKSPSLILDVPELLRRQRAKWQQGLSSFRNDYLEHRKKDIAEFADYYQPKTAEMLFDHAWRTMAELFPAFIEAHYPPTWSIMEIPINERDPKRLRRWRFFQCEPVERGSFTK